MRKRERTVLVAAGGLVVGLVMGAILAIVFLPNSSFTQDALKDVLNKEGVSTLAKIPRQPEPGHENGSLDEISRPRIADTAPGEDGDEPEGGDGGGGGGNGGVGWEDMTEVTKNDFENPTAELPANVSEFQAPFGSPVVRISQSRVMADVLELHGPTIEENRRGTRSANVETVRFMSNFEETVHCNTQEKYGGGDRGVWVCHPRVALLHDTCTVYSFTLAKIPSFESDLQLTFPQCQIHVFAPHPKTLNSLKEKFRGQAQYHQWTVCPPGEDHVVRVPGGGGDAMPCRTLEETMTTLRHTRVDFVRMDVEGIELLPGFMTDSLSGMGKKDPKAAKDPVTGWRGVRQLSLEIHHKGDARRVVELHQALFGLGFELFYKEVNPAVVSMWNFHFLNLGLIKEAGGGSSSSRPYPEGMVKAALVESRERAKRNLFEFMFSPLPATPRGIASTFHMDEPSQFDCGVVEHLANDTDMRVCSSYLTSGVSIGEPRRRPVIYVFNDHQRAKYIPWLHHTMKRFGAEIHVWSYWEPEETAKTVRPVRTHIFHHDLVEVLVQVADTNSHKVAGLDKLMVANNHQRVDLVVIDVGNGIETMNEFAAIIAAQPLAQRQRVQLVTSISVCPSHAYPKLENRIRNLHKVVLGLWDAGFRMVSKSLNRGKLLTPYDHAFLRPEQVCEWSWTYAT